MTREPRYPRHTLTGMLFAWLRNRDGIAGLLFGVALWVFSAVALALAMQANLRASGLVRTCGAGGAELLIRHLHVTATVWGIGFTALQLASLLALTFVLRSCYRLRTAICFVMGAGAVMLGDVLGLFTLLLWLGVTLGAR